MTVAHASLSDSQYISEKGTNLQRNMSMIKKVLYPLFLSVFVSCSQTDKQCYLFAESWNSKCPITLVKNEATLTNVRY